MKQEAEAIGLEGLGSAEAARRLARDGPNSLPDAGGRRWGRIARDAAGEPMYLLLVGAATVYLVLGEPLEGAFLFGMVILMLCLTLYQEGRTERALKALRALGAPSAPVWRDGRMQRLPASELVEGDLVELGEGDRVPADGLLLAASGLLADESLLTGESVPVGKVAAAQGAQPAAPGGADLPWVYSGTLVVQGHGLARVSATGVRSEIGRIGAALGHIVPPRGRLQRETATLARRFAVLGGVVSVLLVALLLVRGSPPLQALLAGIALSMSMLPEEFPVILTVFPAIGAWRLARSQVLTRRLAAIEILRARYGFANPVAINDRGEIAGRTLDNRAALLRNGYVDGFGPPQSGSSDINEKGQVLFDYAPEGVGYRAAVYGGGGLHDLPRFAGNYVSGRAINDAGWVTGHLTTAIGHYHAYVYDGGTVTDLTPWSVTSFGLDINNLGQVVGTVDGRAFLYQDGTLIDLNTLIDPQADLLLTEALAINGRGQILARSCDRAGVFCYDTMLLDPVPAVPEPAHWATLAAGLALLGAGRGRFRASH